MWTNRPSYFLLVQLRHQRLTLTLPIALFVLEDILAGINDLGLLWNSFFPHQKLPALLTAHCLELFQELRRFGSWRFVEIADGEKQISLKFY